ncbi:dolichyl-phosphate-mannose-protein mannosyltransferase [Larkinella arboricola]|uniref:Dolichyl-phosphate-mannose-protein mannosyltransferase n=1 Tax=Larkinella arboricola TaxID=643671 RepID=A0A327X4H9_LARAB|nr:dolichyl-phosphate-mannose-protein mannosyltransferase [Larkinella arboricola]
MSQHRRTSVLILSGIVLLAFVLRLYRADAYGLFFDEKATILISQGIPMEGANQHDVFDKPDSPYFTPKEFWRPKTLADFNEAVSRSDIGHSPAYYAMLWTWIKAFGLSDLSLRFPSILFGTLTVLLVYFFVKRHLRLTPETTDRLALISAFIATIEPLFIAHSHIARNYTMSFFLTLLATHVFLIIIEKEKARKASVGLYIGYCALVSLSILSHYLTVTVFLSHGLYVLFFVRKWPVWYKLGVSFAVALGFVSLWMLFGGGQSTFGTLKYQAEFYRMLAETNPVNNGFGLILPATVPNVFWRAIPVFADLVIFTNGLATMIVGYRNAVVAFLIGLLCIFIIHRYRNQRQTPQWVKFAIPTLLLAGMLYYSIHPLQHLVLSAMLPFFYLLGLSLMEDFRPGDRPLLLFLIMLSLIPTLFLLLMAFRSGHTYGVTQRYSGFSFPYVCILVALMIQKLFAQRLWISLPLAAVLFIQAGFVALLLQQIYNDMAPKYTSYGVPRTKNPFWYSAKKIQELYTPGDTVLYPTLKRKEYTEIDKSGRPYDILDAQLVNIYLPRDATYYQRIDTTEQDKIVLVKGKTGQKITIFDLEGTKYRY